MTLSSSQTRKAPGRGRGRRAILNFSGPLTHDNCAELEQGVSDEIRHHRSEIILDMKHVPLMDSAVLELLVDLSEKMRSQGGFLKIIRLQKICGDILMVTRTMHVLNIYKDLHAAITNTQ